MDPNSKVRFSSPPIETSNETKNEPKPSIKKPPLNRNQSSKGIKRSDAEIRINRARAKTLFLTGTKNIDDLAQGLFDEYDKGKKGYLTKQEMSAALLSLDGTFTSTLMERLFDKIEISKMTQITLSIFQTGVDFFLKADKSSLSDNNKTHHRTTTPPISAPTSASASPHASTPASMSPIPSTSISPTLPISISPITISSQGMTSDHTTSNDTNSASVAVDINTDIHTIFNDPSHMSVEKIRNTATEIFQNLDEDGNGCLTKEELSNAMLQIDPTNFSKERIDAIFDKLDVKKLGYITCDVFSEGFSLFQQSTSHGRTRSYSQDSEESTGSLVSNSSEKENKKEKKIVQLSSPTHSVHSFHSFHFSSPPQSPSFANPNIATLHRQDDINVHDHPPDLIDHPHSQEHESTRRNTQDTDDLEAEHSSARSADGEEEEEDDDDDDGRSDDRHDYDPGTPPSKSNNSQTLIFGASKEDLEDSLEKQKRQIKDLETQLAIAKKSTEKAAKTIQKVEQEHSIQSNENEMLRTQSTQLKQKLKSKQQEADEYLETLTKSQEELHHMKKKQSELEAALNRAKKAEQEMAEKLNREKERARQMDEQVNQLQSNLQEIQKGQEENTREKRKEKMGHMTFQHTNQKLKQMEQKLEEYRKMEENYGQLQQEYHQKTKDEEENRRILENYRKECFILRQTLQQVDPTLSASLGDIRASDTHQFLSRPIPSSIVSSPFNMNQTNFTPSPSSTTNTLSVNNAPVSQSPFEHSPRWGSFFGRNDASLMSELTLAAGASSPPTKPLSLPTQTVAPLTISSSNTPSSPIGSVNTITGSNEVKSRGMPTHLIGNEAGFQNQNNQVTMTGFHVKGGEKKTPDEDKEKERKENEQKEKEQKEKEQKEKEQKEKEENEVKAEKKTGKEVDDKNKIRSRDSSPSKHRHIKNKSLKKEKTQKKHRKFATMTASDRAYFSNIQSEMYGISKAVFREMQIQRESEKLKKKKSGELTPEEKAQIRKEVDAAEAAREASADPKEEHMRMMKAMETRLKEVEEEKRKTQQEKEETEKKMKAVSDYNEDITKKWEIEKKERERLEEEQKFLEEQLNQLEKNNQRCIIL